MGNCCEKPKDTGDGGLKPVSFAHSLKDKTAPYCLNTTVSLKPDRQGEFLESIAQYQMGVLGEKDAIMYRYGEDEKIPGTFHIFEQYKSQEGYKVHTQASHFTTWEEFIGTDPFTESPKVATFHEIRPSTTYHSKHHTGHHTGHTGIMHVTHHGTDSTTKTVGPDQEKLYCVLVSMKVKDTRREGFLQCIRTVQRGTLNDEPLAATYLYGEDDHDLQTFHFHEQYKGPEGWTAHTETPHFKDWEKFAAGDPFIEPPKVVFFTEA